MTAFAATTEKVNIKAESSAAGVRRAISRRKSGRRCCSTNPSSSMTTPVLQVSHLTKSFGPFTAVNDVSFEIHPGEILGLLGPNGAGKTTTIQMLLGVVTPTAGSIHMFGLDLTTSREAILQRVNFSSTYIS